MALPAVAAAVARGLPKLAKFLKKGKGMPLPGAVSGEKEKPADILSVGGVVMLTIGVLLDLASIICAILILAFGVGFLLAKIVYFIGLAIITLWAFSKGDVSPMIFFKKQWKKLAAKAVPAIGDALPIWTWTIYSELKS